MSAFVEAPGGQARIYGVMLPKNYVLPAIVFSSVTYAPNESLRGPNQLETRRFQFDNYATGVNGFLTSRQLSRATKDALCPPDTNGDPTSLRVLLPEGSAIESTRIIMDIDKPFETGEGGFIFCAMLEVEISFVSA